MIHRDDASFSKRGKGFRTSLRACHFTANLHCSKNIGVDIVEGEGCEWDGTGTAPVEASSGIADKSAFDSLEADAMGKDSLWNRGIVDAVC